MWPSPSVKGKQLRTAAPGTAASLRGTHRTTVTALPSSCAGLSWHCPPSGEGAHHGGCALPDVAGKWQKHSIPGKQRAACQCLPKHIYAFPMREIPVEMPPSQMRKCLIWLGEKAVEPQWGRGSIAFSPTQIGLFLYCPMNIELFCAKSSCFLQKHWMFPSVAEQPIPEFSLPLIHKTR